MPKHSVDGRWFLAHRTAYESTRGPIPPGMHLDHICHNLVCVRPDHLRPTTPKQNNEHRRGPNRNSSSGKLGVSWNARMSKWHAQVQHNGTNHRLGYFDTVEEASAVAIAKRNELFTHNDRDRVPA